MPRTERQPTRGHGDRGASPAQLVIAERGLRRALAKTYSHRWIAQNASDLLGEANKEYAEWLATHRPADNPPGWLIHCARLRAIDQVAREHRRAGPRLETVAFALEDPAPSPEQAVLDEDRKRRIEDALSRLPEKDRKLIALVHGEGNSITQAGRLLGWGRSSAGRHHQESLATLKALLGPRDLISLPFLGLVAQAMGPGRLVGGIANRIGAAVQDVADLVSRAFGSVSRNASDAARRAAPWTETGTAAVSGGAGRVAAQCGTIALAALCSAVILSPIEHGGVLGVFSNHHPATGSNPAPAEPPSEPPPIAPESNLGPSPESGGRSASSSAEAKARERRRRRRRRRAQRRAQKIGQARRARKARKVRKVRKARASEAKRNVTLEEEAAPVEEEAAPIEEAAPVEEAVPPAETAAPPAATGAQVRGEFGH